MTADIELLPLPEYLYGREASDNERVVTVANAHAYAIRNVAHATAAKDAEIERLRAEVEAVWAAMPRDARYLDPPDGGCVPLHEQVRRMAADATRAERLAEALQHMVSEAIDGGHNYMMQAIKDSGASELLRDHDQEGKDG